MWKNVLGFHPLDKDLFEGIGTRVVNCVVRRTSDVYCEGSNLPDSLPIPLLKNASRVGQLFLVGNAAVRVLTWFQSAVGKK